MDCIKEKAESAEMWLLLSLQPSQAKMKMKISILLAFLLIITSSLSYASRDHPGKDDNKVGIGGIFGPGGGFNIPGFGGGYGGGFGGPKGGYAKGGVIRPTVVCKDKGPCLGKKLRCPAKCFKSYSGAGKGYGYGGGSGGCTMDCTKKCLAYC